MKNLTENLTINFNTNFWLTIFSFFQKWHRACLREAYTKAEVSLHIGYYLGFQPHPAQERTSPHLTYYIMNLFFTFAPSYQYILAWATLYFSMLHHCISSKLCCKPNNHCAQGPNNDSTHAYSHPLSNLSSLQSPFCSLLVF